jgi:AhpD family alkylhydroperoxidase
MTFSKRTFDGLGHAVRHAAALALRPASLLELVSGRGGVSPALREKLMLSVTAVNKCRYCSFVHTQLALREGFTNEEIDRFLAGDVGDVDDDERVALLYAQHWAEQGGEPTPECRAEVVARYGEGRTRAIETALRAIMFGNYFGNTVDWGLHRLSRGRLARDT